MNKKDSVLKKQFREKARNQEIVQSDGCRSGRKRDETYYQLMEPAGVSRLKKNLDTDERRLSPIFILNYLRLSAEICVPKIIILKPVLR